MLLLRIDNIKCSCWKERGIEEVEQNIAVAPVSEPSKSMVTCTICMEELEHQLIEQNVVLE